MWGGLISEWSGLQMGSLQGTTALKARGSHGAWDAPLTEIRGEVVGGEMASRRKKGHSKGTEVRNKVAGADTPGPDPLSAQWKAPGPGE